MQRLLDGLVKATGTRRDIYERLSVVVVAKVDERLLGNRQATGEGLGGFFVASTLEKVDPLIVEKNGLACRGGAQGIRVE
jgi:hypothetical protein